MEQDERTAQYASHIGATISGGLPLEDVLEALAHDTPDRRWSEPLPD